MQFWFLKSEDKVHLRKVQLSSFSMLFLKECLYYFSILRYQTFSVPNFLSITLLQLEWEGSSFKPLQMLGRAWGPSLVKRLPVTFGST